MLYFYYELHNIHEAVVLYNCNYVYSPLFLYMLT